MSVDENVAETAKKGEIYTWYDRCVAKQSAVIEELFNATTGFCARVTSRAELAAECFVTNRWTIGGWWKKNKQQKAAAVACATQACATTGTGILA